jgi:hypothetical protein
VCRLGFAKAYEFVPRDTATDGRRRRLRLAAPSCPLEDRLGQTAVFIMSRAVGQQRTECGEATDYPFERGIGLI